MKYLIALFISSQALALPFTCVSQETLGGVPVIKFKVTQKVTYYDTHGGEWEHYRVGITPAEGLRELVYGQGDVSNKSIGLTLLRDDFVLGKIIAKAEREDGHHIGIFQMGRMADGRTLEITCEPSH